MLPGQQRQLRCASCEVLVGEAGHMRKERRSTMRVVVIMISLVVLMLMGAGPGRADGFYYDRGYGNKWGDDNIPTPQPSFEDGSRPQNCHTEEYVCGLKCWRGRYGDREDQGMGYCIKKICTRTVCE